VRATIITMGRNAFVTLRDTIMSLGHIPGYFYVSPRIVFIYFYLKYIRIFTVVTVKAITIIHVCKFLKKVKINFFCPFSVKLD